MSDAARLKLQKAVDALRDIAASASDADPQEWADFLADGFEAFLDGRKKSIDEALGIRRSRGRPKGSISKTILDSVVSARMLRSQGKKWREITSEAGVAIEKDAVRKRVARRSVEADLRADRLLVEKQARRLVRSLAARRWRRKADIK